MNKNKFFLTLTDIAITELDEVSGGQTCACHCAEIGHVGLARTTLECAEICKTSSVKIDHCS